MALPKIKSRSPGSFFLIIAFAAALVAAFFAAQAVKLAAPSVSVLVAKQDLAPGERLTEDKLDVKQLPAAAVPQDRVTGDMLDSAIGAHAKTAVAAGDPIRVSHVAELSPPGGTVAARLALTGQKDLRGYALPADATQGLVLEAGDRVDLIGVVDVPREIGADSVTTSKVLVWSAPVLHVPLVDENRPETGNERVIVALRPQEVEKVALAATKGRIHAVINPVGDSVKAETAGVQLHILFPQGGRE